MTDLTLPFSLTSLTAEHSIIVMDPSGNIAFWNREAEDMFGWTSDEVIGKNLHDLVVPQKYHSDFRVGHAMFVKAGQGTAINKTIEVSAKHKDGHEFVVELNLGSFPIHGEWYAIGVVKDVARKKQIEFQLIHADKMESIGTLAAGVAHDFNNILASIIGFTELAMDDTEEGTLIHSNLNEVITAGNRAKDVVRQLLKFSRQAETVLEPVHVKTVVIDTLKLVRAAFPKNIDIRMNLNSDSLVMADSSQIHQILLNLCNNAGHAMKGIDGILTVDLEETKVERSPGQDFRNADSDRYLKLTVSDNGIGMNTEILGKAFTPFFTTKKQGEGSGMGLPTVHGIVASLNGWIYPKSEPGNGSVFEVYLPVIGRDVKTVPKTESLYTNSGIILFVDDEQSVARLGKNVLERMGYKVETAVSGHSALEMFKSSPDSYTLIITDMVMPFMTGEELCREIHRIRPGFPMILCTGYDKTFTSNQLQESGFMAVVTKPILFDEIAETIGRVLSANRIRPEASSG